MIGTDINVFLQNINIIKSDGLTYFGINISGMLTYVAFINFLISIDYIVLGGRVTNYFYQKL